MSLHKAREELENFREEFTDGASQSKAAAWANELDQFELEYRERVLTREAEEVVSRAKAELNFAEGHFDHHRYDKSLESLALARQAAGAISVETRFQGVSVVRAFESEFDPRVRAFTEKFDARMLEREAADRVREMNAILGEMEDHFSHHRDEKALEAYNSSRDKRTALDAAEGERFASRAEVKAADADAEKRQGAFKAAYADRVLSAKLNEGTRAALGKLNEAADMLTHSRFEEALAAHHTARELAGGLGADPILLGMKAVDDFLKEFAPKAEELAQKINATTRARAQAEAKRVAESALTTAQELFAHHRSDRTHLACARGS